MRRILVVGCVLIGIFAGCSDDGVQTADTSTTQVADQSWFAFRPVAATSQPPCAIETTPASDSSACYELGEQLVGPSGIISASAASQPAQTAWTVALTLSADALRTFNDGAAQCFQRATGCPSGQMAIVIDGVVLSAPVLQAPRFEGNAFQVSGDFTEAEARNLASRFE